MTVLFSQQREIPRVVSACRFSNVNGRRQINEDLIFSTIGNPHFTDSKREFDDLSGDGDMQSYISAKDNYIF